MKESLMVLNSNKPNRYNIVFPISTLISSVDQSWEYGLSMNMGHDMHRPIAWMRGLGIYIEPNLCRLLGLISFPENSKEENLIKQIHTANLAKRYISSAENDFKKILSKFPNSDIATQKDLKPFKYECSAIVKNKLAEDVFPEIFSQKDKDGLIDISILHPYKPGLFKVGDLILFAHPFFRRSLSKWNAYCSEFLEIFQNLKNRPGVKAKIALDPNAIGLLDSYKDRLEFEYWWGPKFNDDLSKISFGVTQHVEQDIFKRQCLEIEKTEFFWGLINGIKTFECEEVKNQPSLGVSNEFYGCRYIHSMLNDAGDRIAHVDGAIRGYNQNQIGTRQQTPLDKLGRQTEYKKLWRVDGDIGIELWKELICHYFRGNHLVGEYLGGVESRKSDRPFCPNIEKEETPVYQYVPTNLSPNDGIRICISYQHRNDKIVQGRTIVSCDSFTRADGQTIKYFETDTIELLKVLRMKGKEILFYDDYSRVDFHDTVLNFPLITHCGSNFNDLLHDTIDAIKLLCEARRNVDQLISFSLGAVVGNKEIIFSFAGHVIDLSKWFNSPYYMLPPSEGELKEWCEDVYGWITKEFKPNIDEPKVEQLVKTTGILKFERKSVDPHLADFHMEGNNIICEVLMPKDEVEKVQQCGLSIAPVMLIKKSRCSKTNGDYLRSEYSKYLHSDVTEICEDFEFLGSFWTNRHA